MDRDVVICRSSGSWRNGMISLWQMLLLTAVAALVIGAVTALLVSRSADSVPGTTDAETERVEIKDYVFVPFRTVVVNLKGERLTRFLQATIVMQVEAGNRRHLETVLEARKVLFQDWLITYLSDKSVEDVEGAAAMRKLKREIKDGFNSILTVIGAPFEIESVLFEEFNVQ